MTDDELFRGRVAPRPRSLNGVGRTVTVMLEDDPGPIASEPMYSGPQWTALEWAPVVIVWSGIAVFVAALLVLP